MAIRANIISQTFRHNITGWEGLSKSGFVNNDKCPSGDNCVEFQKSSNSNMYALMSTMGYHTVRITFTIRMDLTNSRTDEACKLFFWKSHYENGLGKPGYIIFTDWIEVASHEVDSTKVWDLSLNDADNIPVVYLEFQSDELNDADDRIYINDVIVTGIPITVNPTSSPSKLPSLSPSKGSTKYPTLSPSDIPSKSPIKTPTSSPALNPVIASLNPTFNPSFSPSFDPTLVQDTPLLTVTDAHSLDVTKCPDFAPASTELPSDIYLIIGLISALFLLWNCICCGILWSCVYKRRNRVAKIEDDAKFTKSNSKTVVKNYGQKDDHDEMHDIHGNEPLTTDIAMALVQMDDPGDQPIKGGYEEISEDGLYPRGLNGEEDSDETAGLAMMYTKSSKAKKIETAGMDEHREKSIGSDESDDEAGLAMMYTKSSKAKKIETAGMGEHHQKSNFVDSISLNDLDDVRNNEATQESTAMLRDTSGSQHKELFQVTQTLK
eukprot:79585_1